MTKETIEDSQVRILVATGEDAPSIREIYAPYVTGTAITFDTEIPSVEDQRRKILHTLERYPFLVARCGEEVAGYAYAGPFKDRPAYDWSVEVSIYIRQDRRQGGIGRRLYGALEEILFQMGICNLYACITSVKEPDEYVGRGSILFHERMGYHLVGEFPSCGYKFGRWYGMCWMQKKIRQNACPAGEVRFFPELRMSLTTPGEGEWEVS